MDMVRVQPVTACQSWATTTGLNARAGWTIHVREQALQWQLALCGLQLYNAAPGHHPDRVQEEDDLSQLSITLLQTPESRQ